MNDSILKVDHIGYAVNDMEKAVKKFLLLGYQLYGGGIDDNERQVRIQFLVDANGTRVELVAPLDGESPIDNWIEKNGNSPYHICCESGNIESDTETLKANGFIMVHKISPAPAMGGRRVAFLYSMETGLFELVEREMLS